MAAPRRVKLRFTPHTRRRLAYCGAAPSLATDQATFEKLVAKVAPRIIAGEKFKPKLACGCISLGPGVADPGVVVTDALGRIRCAFPLFDAAGDHIATELCFDEFVVLGR